MDRLWKVRFITDKGEACYLFANAADARIAAEVFAAYPNPCDIVIIETPDRRFVPADRVDLLWPPETGAPDSHVT